MLLLTSCTSVYKQAQKQTYFKLFIFMCGAFLSHLVLRCTNRHRNKPISSCLCLLVGAFSRILYFDVQPGTKTNLFLVVYVYGVVLFLASCTSMYKQAPKQPFFSCLYLWSDAFTQILYVDLQAGTKTNLSLVVYVYGMVLWLASCTSVYKRHQNIPSFNCLRSWDVAFRLILYIDVQTGTKTNLF